MEQLAKNHNGDFQMMFDSSEQLSNTQELSNFDYTGQNIMNEDQSMTQL